MSLLSPTLKDLLKGISLVLEHKGGSRCFTNHTQRKGESLETEQ